MTSSWFGRSTDLFELVRSATFRHFPHQPELEKSSDASCRICQSELETHLSCLMLIPAMLLACNFFCSLPGPSLIVAASCFLASRPILAFCCTSGNNSFLSTLLLGYPVYSFIGAG